MSDYLMQVISERRQVTRDDVLSQLAAAEVDGQQLAHEDIVGFFQLLIVGGQETTANLINNIILCLLENPIQFALLRNNRQLLPSAIEETLRYRSPVQWMMRTPSREIQICDQTLLPGQLILAVIGSANRDSKQFARAEEFDIARNRNPHLAFGHGIHFCLGAALARLEARVAVSSLLERLTDLERVDDRQWEPRKALHVHGPTRLHIRFRPVTDRDSAVFDARLRWR
jgi:cytochrome P450